METVHVEICLGTTCYVMGASELQSLASQLPDALRDRVTVTGTTCLELCRDRKYGKAPYARVDGEAIPGATVAGIVARIHERLGIPQTET
jgi:NADH:ubiquinone oxidoreductase subunit E